MLNYKLKLSKHIKIHLTFYISLIKKTFQNIKTYTSEVKNKIKYEVKKILEQQKINEQIQYLVKWKEYNHSKNTYKLVKNLKNLQALIESFHHQEKK